MIRTMGFNLRYGEADDGINSWLYRQELTIDRIRAFDPDLLGIQECLHGQQADYVRAQLSDYEFFARPRGSVERPDAEMAPILYRRSRYKLISSGCFWISETPDVEGSISWGSAHARIAMWVRLADREATKQHLTFINTHLDYLPEPAYEGAKRLRTELDTRFAGEACILTGDFNSEKDSPAYQALVEDSSGLSDTFRVANPDEQDEGTYQDFGRLQPGTSIDWLLATSEFTTVEAGIDRYHQGELYPSDHCPIFAVLKQSA